MRIAIGGDILGVNKVTQAVMSIGTLVVSDRPTVGAATPHAASMARLHLTGTKTRLAWECVALWVAIGTVQIGGLKMLSQMVLHLTTR